MPLAASLVKKPAMTSDRSGKLAQALRDNLRRRKAQAASRAEVSEATGQGVRYSGFRTREETGEKPRDGEGA